jgi:hypothetical protein
MITIKSEVSLTQEQLTEALSQYLCNNHVNVENITSIRVDYDQLGEPLGVRIEVVLGGKSPAYGGGE